MLTFPFRILTTVFIALFCYSRFVRRAVAAVLVSAVIVAAQQGGWSSAGLDGATPAQTSALQALVALVGG